MLIFLPECRNMKHTCAERVHREDRTFFVSSCTPKQGMKQNSVGKITCRIKNMMQFIIHAFTHHNAHECAWLLGALVKKKTGVEKQHFATEVRLFQFKIETLILSFQQCTKAKMVTQTIQRSFKFFAAGSCDDVTASNAC